MTSHRASTVFCWFPPESARTGASIPDVLIRSLFTCACASARSRARLTTPARASVGSRTIETFQRTGLSTNSASPLRSSGTIATPARMASAGERNRSA